MPRSRYSLLARSLLLASWRAGPTEPLVILLLPAALDVARDTSALGWSIWFWNAAKMYCYPFSLASTPLVIWSRLLLTTELHLPWSVPISSCFLPNCLGTANWCLQSIFKSAVANGGYCGSRDVGIPCGSLMGIQTACGLIGQEVLDGHIHGMVMQ